MKYYWTADTHFDHGNIMKYCNRLGLSDFELKGLERERQDNRFKLRVSQESIDIMNEYLLDGINSKVGRDDVLIHNGDFCLNGKVQYFRSKIKCRNVYLIWGNHDRRKDFYNLFSGTYDMYTLRVNNQEIVNCHYALAIWNKMHRGAIHCYGHSHSQAEEKLNTLFPERRSMDVGVDNAYKILGKYAPFSFDEIMDLIGNRKGSYSDHHESKSED